MALRVVESCAHHTVLCTRAHEATACKLTPKPNMLKTASEQLRTGSDISDPATVKKPKERLRLQVQLATDQGNFNFKKILINADGVSYPCNPYPEYYTNPLQNLLRGWGLMDFKQGSGLRVEV